MLQRWKNCISYVKTIKTLSYVALLSIRVWNLEFSILESIECFQAHGEIETLILFESIVIFIAALLLVMIACEIGQRFCNAFEDVEYALSQINVYLLPREVQRLLPMVIMYSQEPFVVQFFGSLCCTRVQFQKVTTAPCAQPLTTQKKISST